VAEVVVVHRAKAGSSLGWNSSSMPEGPFEDEPQFSHFPAPGLVRRVRRIGRFSQRELAQAARVSRGTIGRIESGSLVPSFAVFQRIIGVIGLGLVVVNDEGKVIQPMLDWNDALDGADRRYPSHLDTIIDPEPGEWWADQYGLARPPETFHRDNEARAMQRRRSQWEVRVKRHRHEPPPPKPEWY
jgi:transcriptional regulator with XRE-family HTH domain